ncbi:hypothetical protein DFH29DRAFT_897918, partial [Suillus ampliporus]
YPDAYASYEIPSVTLDADFIMHRLIGHVLFLKTKFPPPLSTAFALRSGTPRKDAQNSGRAYLAVVLGPTPGSAKCRVMVGVDALEAKVWGERDDCSGVPSEHEREISEDESNLDNDSDSEVDSNESDDSDDAGDEAARETESDESSQGPSPPRSAACGENDGQGMASEMPPTQTHIVLRAPRRFMHPAWVPRQTLSGAFDTFLHTFLEESGEQKKGVKVEGVWIRSRQGITEESESGEIPEEDEMIWWTWDGKLVGFADW